MKWMLVIFLLFVSFLGRVDYPERKEVMQHSEYLGKEYATYKPLAYVKNLPHVEDVSLGIARNSSVLVAKEATREIEDIINRCGNCIDSQRLVTPIRLEFIPVGTKLKVVGEYLYSAENCLGTSTIHMLLIQDEQGNISEMSEIGFKLDIEGALTKKYYQVSLDEKEVLDILKQFNHKKQVKVRFCPSLNIVEHQGVHKFIYDFKLEHDVDINPSNTCEKGTVFTFHNPDSFLTTHYYAREWGVHGDWFLE